MAVPIPNHITACNLGQNGDAEFVVACKGRPFSILTSPQLPTPTVNYVDYGLIRELNLRITDLQCNKLFYGGEKLRILGKVATSVQCIVNGSPFGNIYFKAHVVEDLKKMFNTHAIASEKLRKRFTGPTKQVFTEPTDDSSDDDEKPKKKKRKKGKTKKRADSAADVDKKPAPSKAGPPTPPRPICQGNWMKIQSYRGWHSEHGYGGPPGVLRDCYQHRDTGETQNERPECWDSDGSFHSESSAPPLVFPSSDEYEEDMYTNISTIRHCDKHQHDVPPNDTAVTNSAMTAHPPPFLSIQEAREALTGNAAAMSSSSPASPNTIVKQMTLNCQRAGMDTASMKYALQCAGIDTSNMAGIFDANLPKSNDPKHSNDPTKRFTKDGKSYTKDDLKRVGKLRREGRDVPLSLKHVPRLHGPDWCHAGCGERRSIVPHACGYHIGWGSVTACAPDCNGGYCDHYQDESDYREQEDGMS